MQPLQESGPPAQGVPPVPRVKEGLHGGGAVVRAEPDEREEGEVAEEAACALIRTSDAVYAYAIATRHAPLPVARGDIKAQYRAYRAQ